jgi:hypothetical protein
MRLLHVDMLVCLVDGYLSAVLPLKGAALSYVTTEMDCHFLVQPPPGTGVRFKHDVQCLARQVR